MNLFGKKKKLQDYNEVQEKLRKTTSLLFERERYLQTKVDQETINAKEFLKKGNKKGALTYQDNITAALLTLKKCKLYKEQLERLRSSMLALESQTLDLDSTAVINGIDAPPVDVPSLLDLDVRYFHVLLFRKMSCKRF